MNIQTSRNNIYSYLRQTNEIVPGAVDDNNYAWTFAPFTNFSAMPEVYMFIISITEQCNLRCTYCCYSGGYLGNHSHNTRSLCEGDMDKILKFIDRTVAPGKSIRISFYGGEPLTQYPLIQFAVKEGKEIWGNRVTFSISTNGTLLTPEIIAWLVDNEIEIAISIDGTENFHNRHRVDAGGHGSFAQVYSALEYLHDQMFSKRPIVALLMTLPSVSDLEHIAGAWQADSLLRNYSPAHITGLTPNFPEGVATADWEKLQALYIHLIDLYQQHPDWAVLRTFFDEMIEIWSNRMIFKVEGETPMSTCLPVNTKLYIDSHLQLAVCEKINDQFRIGSVEKGIDWKKANQLAKDYYGRRETRCTKCPAVRMCNLCLTAVAYTNDQWDILCHNERLNHRLGMFVFCEMAERGMLVLPTVPELHGERCTLNAVEESDIPVLRDIFSDSVTQRFLPDLCDIAKTDADIRQILQSFRTYLSKGEGILWGIRWNDTLVGFVAVMDLSFNPTIFFAMHPMHRNQGLMRESVELATQYICDAKLCNELHTEVDETNIPSRKVMENCGYSICEIKNDKIIYQVKYNGL